jgi:hypothetical protein
MGVSQASVRTASAAPVNRVIRCMVPPRSGSRIAFDTPFGVRVEKRADPDVDRGRLSEQRAEHVNG